KAQQKNEGGVLAIHPPNTIYLWELGRAVDPELLVEMAGVEFHTWVWSPDGTKLAVSTWDAENFSRTWVVDTKTKKLEEIKLPRYKVEGKEYGMSLQAWSPDGAWFLAAGDSGLHLVKADGSVSRRLTKGTKTLLDGTCRFSPDGRRVLFAGVNPDKSM